MKTRFFACLLCIILMVSCGDSGQTPDIPPSGSDTEQPGGKPDNGDEEKPDEPGTPDQPDQPDQPDEPGTPDQPDQPA